MLARISHQRPVAAPDLATITALHRVGPRLRRFARKTGEKCGLKSCRASADCAFN